ncbi:HU family DNA-binding protein [Moraxella bovis]|uniref:HU family DNA-binding protein n=1 Tax=Moraxella bovis TaxID=476 RepID=A0AAQ2Q3H7_MORBO|nr:HU family DNA-binding protein [Moraxella bovis]AWY21249.1 HU family DNA-binding protein [Moraxella bovis]OOR88309.1 DNA-binding protein HU [Moraxella bovis]UYZ75438.1 HU family DNA-binding protein [Moraxella bovis]UYZ78619.1 HU family DNA-binding protein [Moraxella bovis]UYZ81512.1 HU family DNA-binding protein [Moraxella bovis]
MNKKELIQAVGEKTDNASFYAKNVIDATLAVISDTLTKGDEVMLVGFGTFSVRTQKARTARNPKTGEKIQVPAKKVPSFKAGKGLKEAVN